MKNVKKKSLLLLMAVVLMVLAVNNVNAVLPDKSNLIASYSCDNIDVNGATLNDEKNDYKLDGDIVGGVTTGLKGIIGQACNGTGAIASDGVRINRSTTPLDNMFENLNWSIEEWHNTTTTETDHLWGTEDATSGITRLTINDEVGNGRMLVYHLDGVALGANYVNMANNAWIYVVVTYETSRKNLSIWVNGTFDNSRLVGTASAGANRDFFLFVNQDVRDTFDGLLDEIRIYNTTLVDHQILSLYNNHLGTDYSNLTGGVNAVSINISLNDTSLVQGEKVNITGNWSADADGSIGQIIVNQTGENVIYNFSLSGTSGYFGQNITISLTTGGAINFTTRLNDTSNKFNQSSQVIIVGDITPPIIVNFSLQHQPIMNKSNTNKFQIFCEDSENNIKRLNFTLNYNRTGDNFTRFVEFGSTTEGGVNVTYNITNSAFGVTSVLPPTSSPATVEDRKSYYWNYSLFDNQEVAREGHYNMTFVGCNDVSLNYAENSSDRNNMKGDYAFLIDTPPIINSRNPTNDSNFTSALNTTGNLVITEDNPSFMLLFHNISGKWGLNQTINYSGDGTTQNLFNLTGMVDKGKYVYSTSINTSFGTWTNSSNITFGVIVSESGGDVGGGTTGGGGGGDLTPKPIQNITIVQPERCGNFVCESCVDSNISNCIDETPLSCPQDCKLFSLDDTFCTPIFNCGNWLQNWFLNFMLLLVIGGLIVTQYRADKKKKRL